MVLFECLIATIYHNYFFSFNESIHDILLSSKNSPCSTSTRSWFFTSGYSFLTSNELFSLWQTINSGMELLTAVLDQIRKFVSWMMLSDRPSFIRAVLFFDEMILSPWSSDSWISMSSLFSVAWSVPENPDNLNFRPLETIVELAWRFFRNASRVEVNLLLVL